MTDDQIVKQLFDQGLVAVGGISRPGFADFRIPTVTMSDRGEFRFWMPYETRPNWIEWTRDVFFEHFSHFILEPCIHCGAPIDPDNRGHEEGCSYE